ncbi:hypothetical protein J2744_000020 [Halorubrum trapanicum]|uniref:DUF8009 domain-containing protein n=1 Tax=Halorubrum trapanicum TaxID=29284 RepID=A0A8J7UNI5_9EURY|nr:hypothetical protein [Halorubrum trapanicum]MBP1900368.1 hypothetical protein [Halorubrum trapanicum]
MTEEEPGSDPGPGRIRSIAVHREDVANALEAALRSDREVVLRATPPFSGRMRARLHALDAGGDGTDERDARSADDAPAPLHIDPRDLVADVPPYPEPDDTAAEHPDTDLEARRERHAEAVEDWRERVRRSIGSSVEIDGDGDSRAVDVVALG